MYVLDRNESGNGRAAVDARMGNQDGWPALLSSSCYWPVAWSRVWIGFLLVLRVASSAVVNLRAQTVGGGGAATSGTWSLGGGWGWGL